MMDRKTLKRKSGKSVDSKSISIFKEKIEKRRELVSESKEKADRIAKIKEKKAELKAKKSEIVEKDKLVSESKKEKNREDRIAKLKEKSAEIKSSKTSLISESKKKEIAKIKAKKKLAKKSEPVKELLAQEKVGEFVTESVKRKISDVIGKRRSMKKDIIKEADETEEDVFDELIDETEEVGDGDGIEVSADIELNTEEPLEIVIQQDDLESIILGVKDELLLDEEFVNTVVNKIAGTEEPMDEINDDLDTEVDMDMLEDGDLEELDSEGDILGGMLEEEGITPKMSKAKLTTESFDVKLDGDIIVEGLEGFENTKSDKMIVNVFKYNAIMLDKVSEFESTLGKLSLIKESIMSPDDEIGKFDVDIDEEGETISISSSSKISDVSGEIEKRTGLKVGKVSMTPEKEEIEIDTDVEDELDYDLSYISKF